MSIIEERRVFMGWELRRFVIYTGWQMNLLYWDWLINGGIHEMRHVPAQMAWGKCWHDCTVAL
ncbi:MAG: hypothetical protein A2143_00675 [Gallionellales bacterium RBG_16_57_15]|nr:MAG: hypothetical protein A2143_00675 [Gallionellales bacterium RBG_16_57_15]